MDNVLQVKTAVKEGRCAVGTVDTWMIWVRTASLSQVILKSLKIEMFAFKNLVGNSTHLTDVTNASRTMLMNLKTLQWDDQLCK